MFIAVVGLVLMQCSIAVLQQLLTQAGAVEQAFCTHLGSAS
jgi:hypothetical protein